MLDISQGHVAHLEAGDEPKAGLGEKIRVVTNGAVTWPHVRRTGTEG